MTAKTSTPTPVFFDHDGGVDDFMSLLILLCYPEKVKLLGVSVIEADCHIKPAVSITQKLLDLIGRSDIVVGESTLTGRNPFPGAWRLDASRIDNLPVLNFKKPVKAKVAGPSGQQFFADTIIASPDPVTLVMTGPLNNLAWALEKYPAIVNKISELIWMGGAVDVIGNVVQPGHDSSAEWNVYWDPTAAKKVFDSNLKIRIFSLDSTNHVPVTVDFVKRFGENWSFPLSNFAGSAWAMASFEQALPGETYYAWDTLTAAFTVKPDICEFEEVHVVVIEDGPSQGRTKRDDANGRPVLMAKNVKVKEFYDLCLESFKR